MDTTYGKAVALAVPVFLALIILEVIIDRIKAEPATTRSPTPSTSLVVGSSPRACASSSASSACSSTSGCSIHAPIHLPSDHWATWIFAFVLYDFCYYWNHRLGHTVRLLLGFPRRPSPERGIQPHDSAPADRHRIVHGWIFYVPLALCGVPLGVYL